MLQLNELNESRLEAYESSKSYKEWAKYWYDKHIMKNRFQESNVVLLLNSKLRLFSNKLRSRWSGQFKVTKVYPHGATEV